MWLSDEEYVFQQDIKEKKAAGRGAFHRKCGSKSKKCTLPHERLTKKELEKMNGEVMTYNPNAWYSWEEFMKLPDEYQTKYVNSLMTRYNCSFAAVAEVVFGKKSTNLYAFLKRRGSLQYINMPDKTTGKKLLPGKQRLKNAYESAINSHEDEPEEIQNGSSEEPKELTLQEKIKQAQDTLNLYESRGMPITVELINKIYEEKTGMSFALAKECIDESIGVELDNPGEPVEEIEDAEDSTNVRSFSIVMDHIDMSIIQYVSDLFNGKKISVYMEVKEVL